MAYQKTFFDEDDRIQLIDVSYTGSDVHKIGGGVSILHFEINNKRRKKIIYKPSAVLIDALIIGNIQSISHLSFQFDQITRFELGNKSFFEIVNEYLKKEKMLSDNYEIIMPTYKILPIENINESNKKRIKNAYVYIQFLENDLWNCDFDPEKITIFVNRNRL